MRLEIRYLNEFNYSEPVWESHNVLRACPATNDNQKMIEYRLEVTPTARVHSHLDFWGTRVDEFGIREPHSTLRVCAESTVETGQPVEPEKDGSLDAYISLKGDLSEYLQPSPHATWNGEITETAREALAGNDTFLSAIAAIDREVTNSLAYETGATFVGMPVGDVLAQGKGVCQDFAHLGIAMYRSVGIPARYVSGYLYAADQTDAVAPEEAELDIQTHAWLEVAVPGQGWWALDPTNPQPVSELHVKIGHGRDYEDVMPLRGVYHGGARHDLGVRVQISRDRLAHAGDQ
ncbi:MAG: transglutaminase family protein [Acidimicrobiia bacterium]